MFTEEQYDQAIEDLMLAKSVIKNPVPGCPVCGGHCAPHQCGRNPLYAMYMCEQITRRSDQLHHALHILAGENTFMGEPVGPCAIRAPRKSNAQQEVPGDE